MDSIKRRMPPFPASSVFTDTELLASLTSRLMRAEETNGRNETYFKEAIKFRELGRSRGIDAAMKEHTLDALVLPGAGASSTPAGW